MRFLPTIQPLIPPQWASLMDGRMSRYGNRCPLLSPILQNPVPCGKATGRRVSGNADGLLGDAHDAADVAVFHAHLVEDEEECVVGGHGSVFLLDAAERGEVGSLTLVDEA